MKRILALVALCLSVSILSFGAAHTLTRSAKAVGHESYKVTKDVAHASVSTVTSISCRKEVAVVCKGE